jgi:uncharacterized protein involved in exopolysaccharide biosynthesis
MDPLNFQERAMANAYAGDIGGAPPRAIGRGADEFDLLSIGRALRAKARPILGLTLLALIGSFLFVNFATPRYTSEASVLLQNADNYYTRQGADRDGGAQAPIDDQAVQSQVLLMGSRELSLEAIRRLHLVGNPEFDPLAGPPKPWTRLLVLAGLVPNPANLTPENRVLAAFSDRLRIYAARNSRVINVEFTSADPKLAADAANMMANLYLKALENAKKQATQSAGDWLSGAIAPLRRKVDEAEAKVAAFRAANGLLIGTNGVTINAQQLADLNAQLAAARAAEADAQSKAKLLRQMIKAGRVLDITAVANNDLIRQLSAQRASLSAQIALEGRTLLPQHPRMKELAAQLAALDAQIRLAAEKVARGFENDARIAHERVDSITAALDAQKKVAAEGNEKEVELRALERDAKAARDQLEAYLAKYREAQARDTDKAVPPDARIISPALVTSTPSFPKKLPIIAIATLATLVVAAAAVAAKEIAMPGSGGAPRPALPDVVETPDGRGRREPPAEEGTSARADRAPRPAAALDDEQRQARSGSTPAVAPAPPVEAEAAVPAEVADLSDLAARLLSLKPAKRGIIVLVSRASDADRGPVLSLPLAREIARVASPVVVDLESDGRSASLEAGLADAPGLGDLAAGRIGFSEAIHRDIRSGLHVVPAGTGGGPGMPSRMEDVATSCAALAHSYDAVLIDARPADYAGDAAALVKGTDAVLVVRGEADDATMAAALERFAALEPPLLLAVEAPADPRAEPRLAAE